MPGGERSLQLGELQPTALRRLLQLTDPFAVVVGRDVACQGGRSPLSPVPISSTHGVDMRRMSGSNGARATKQGLEKQGLEKQGLERRRSEAAADRSPRW